MNDVTLILSKIKAGDPSAARELLPLVYEELRKLAAQRMLTERIDHTLQATALVHEAYLRLVDVDQIQSWDSRGHFFSAAAEAMRRILVDHARSKASLKRDAPIESIELTTLEVESGHLSPEKLLELDDLLHKLEDEDPAIAELVRLRVFAGLSVNEAAEALGLPRSTAFDWWKYARVWFQLEVAEAPR